MNYYKRMLWVEPTLRNRRQYGNCEMSTTRKTQACVSGCGATKTNQFPYQYGLCGSCSHPIPKQTSFILCTQVYLNLTPSSISSCTHKIFISSGLIIINILKILNFFYFFSHGIPLYFHAAFFIIFLIHHQFHFHIFVNLKCIFESENIYRIDQFDM